MKRAKAKIRLQIKSTFVFGETNIYAWEPDDPLTFATTLMVDIGATGKESADMFTLRIATPKGLDALTYKDNIVAMGPLLVMKSYDANDLWNWLTKTVESCESNSWQECLENLRRYFLWEYDEYTEA